MGVRPARRAVWSSSCGVTCRTTWPSCGPRSPVSTVMSACAASRCDRSRLPAARRRSTRTSSPSACWGCRVDFEFTAEQEELRTSVRRFLAAGTGEMWAGLTDLGMLDRTLTMTDHGVVLEEMGRALYPGPYLSTLAARWAGLDDDLVVATLALDLTHVPDAMVADVVLVPDGDDLYVVDDFEVVPVTTPDGTPPLGA